MARLLSHIKRSPDKKDFSSFLIIFLVVSLSGCASLGTYNPATGRTEFIFVSTPDELALGQQMHPQITGSYKESSDQAQRERVARVGKKLAQISDRQDYSYKFYLLESDELNAFTTPGGNIYIFSGLLKKLSSDDQLASVLAHEIGHCAAKHIVKKYQAALGYNIFQSLLLSYISKNAEAQKIVSLTTDMTTQLIFSAFSRSDEYEADRLGLKYMNKAGFNLQGMIDSFEMLRRESKGPRLPLYFQTHPYLEDRIIAAKAEIQKLKGNI